MTHKKSHFGLGVILAAIAGAIAGIFFAPKTGKEMRKDAKKLSNNAKAFADEYKKKLDKKEPEEVAKIVFGDVSAVTTKLSKKAHKDLSVELALLREKYKTIDKKKYQEAVKTVVDSIREDKVVPEGSLKKLAAYLEKDAKKLVAKPDKKATPKKKTTRKIATKKPAVRKKTVN